MQRSSREETLRQFLSSLSSYCQQHDAHSDHEQVVLDHASSSTRRRQTPIEGRGIQDSTQEQKTAGVRLSSPQSSSSFDASTAVLVGVDAITKNKNAVPSTSSRYHSDTAAASGTDEQPVSTNRNNSAFSETYNDNDGSGIPTFLFQISCLDIRGGEGEAGPGDEQGMKKRYCADTPFPTAVLKELLEMMNHQAKKKDNRSWFYRSSSNNSRNRTQKSYKHAERIEPKDERTNQKGVLTTDVNSMNQKEGEGEEEEDIDEKHMKNVDKGLGDRDPTCRADPIKGDKFQIMQRLLDRKLRFDLYNTTMFKGTKEDTSASEQGTMSKAMDTLHSNLKETMKILILEQLVTLTAKLLFKSIQSKGGIIHDQTAKSLAGSLSSMHGSFYTEYHDQMTVFRALENWKPSPLEIEYAKKFMSQEKDTKLGAGSLQTLDARKSESYHLHKNQFSEQKTGENYDLQEKKFSSEDEDAQLVAASLKAYPSTCYNSNGRGDTNMGTRGWKSVEGSVKEESQGDSHQTINPALCRASSLSQVEVCDRAAGGSHSIPTAYSRGDGLEHIAPIASIHGSGALGKDSLYSTILASTKLEPSDRRVSMVVKRYTMRFSCQTGSEIDNVAVDSCEPTLVSEHLLLDCQAIVQVGKCDFELNFQCPGTITGNFEEQNSVVLKEVTITLDSKKLLENLMKQVSIATRKAIASNKELLLSKTESNITHMNKFQSDKDLEAAQALSEISSSPMLQNGKKMIPQNSSPKRNVKRVRIESMDLNTPSQVRRRSRMSSLDVVSEALRLAENGRIRTFSDVYNNDKESLYQQPNFGGSSDIDTVLGSMRRGSASMGLGDFHSTQMPGRGSASYNMAAAAEAVRLAEAENNLHSLTNMQQVDAYYNRNINHGSVLNSQFGSTFGRRPSYSNNNTMPLSAHDTSLERARNNYSGRDSFSFPNNNFGFGGIDSLLMNQGNITNGNLNSYQPNLGMGNWFGDSRGITSETGQYSVMDLERGRRSSLTDAMNLVDMDALRRSSAGLSMAAAAEAVRLSEANPYINPNVQSYAPPSSESYLNHSESLDNLAALMRRSSGPQGSMASAAKTVTLAELESWSRRSFGGPNNRTHNT